MEQRVEVIERVAVECAHCLDTGCVVLTFEEGGEEYEEAVQCRRCNGAGVSGASPADKASL